MKKTIEEIISEIIIKKDGQINVDWDKFFEMERIRDERGYEKIINELEKNEILTLETNGAYTVIACGMDCAPLSHGLIRMYFSREEDAKRYATAKYGHAMYEVMISQFTDKIKTTPR